MAGFEAGAFLAGGIDEVVLSSADKYREALDAGALGIRNAVQEYAKWEAWQDQHEKEYKGLHNNDFEGFGDIIGFIYGQEEEV